MSGIRALETSDAFDMTKLHEASFEKGWSEPDMIAHIHRDIALGLGDPLSGFLIIRTAGDQAELLTLAVDPNLRRSGFGRALLLRGELSAAKQGVDILFLEVAEDNVAAAALYRALGYEAFGRRPAYYRRPEGRVAALTFRKKLLLDAPLGEV